MKRKKELALFALSLAVTFVLSGCMAVNFDKEKEDMSLAKDWGETAEVDYSFKMLMLEFGPYRLQVTPMGPITLQSGGRSADCIEVRYKVLSTDDGKPADFANCLCAVSLLDQDLEGVGYDIWYKDANMNNADVRGTLNVGEEYTFFIPLKEGLEGSGLAFVVVSDRAGYYVRNGSNFYYAL